MSRRGIHDERRVVKPTRTPTFKPLSTMQNMVADLLGMRMSYQQIADILKVAPITVRLHTRMAARKIPGDFPAQVKVMAWARGATRDVLEGHTLRYYVQTTALRKKKPLAPATDHSDRAIAAATTDPSSQHHVTPPLSREPA